LETSRPADQPWPAGEPLRSARVRVDLAAIVGNWRILSACAPGAETAAVLKADAYGHGAQAAALALAAAGCRTFFTATLGEAIALRAAMGPGPRVLALNGLAGAAPRRFREAHIEPVLNSLSEIRDWAGLGPWALHIDTGMNRLGLEPKEAPAAADLTRAHPPALVLSHLACGDDPTNPANARQLSLFSTVANLFPTARRSLAATGGVAMCASAHCDLIRPGVSLYGVWDTSQPMPPLRPAMTVEAPILQVRWVEPGEAVGYGGAYRAASRQLLAAVGIGYADGFLRSLSNKGYGAVEGAICPVRGRISMDLTMLDVTAAQRSAAPGAMVELLGPTIAASAQAALAGAIAYELLTSLGGAAARVGQRVSL